MGDSFQILNIFLNEVQFQSPPPAPFINRRLLGPRKSKAHKEHTTCLTVNF